MKRHLLLFALLLLISGAMFGQLAVSPTSLDGFTYDYGGGPSTALDFSVSGTSLPTNVTVAAPTGFEVSFSEGDNYSSNLTLTPVEGTLIDTTVYVRMVNGLAIGDHGGEINVTCGDNFSATVILNGSVNAIGIVELTTFNPEAGTYNAAQNVNINCPTDGASIFYSTVSGNGPWISYTGAITVNESMTIWAYASKEGYTDSTVASATYTINTPEPELNVTPTSLEDFTYVFGYGPSNSNWVTVTGSNLNGDVTINTNTNHFQISLTEVGNFSTNLTLTPIEGTLTGTTVYVQMAAELEVGTYTGNINVNGGDGLSETVNLRGEVTQQPTVATPILSPTTGAYPGPLTVSINCSTENATIRYTTTGTEPTQNSPVYSTPLTIDSTATVKAKAWKNGYQASATASATYTITYTIRVSANPPNGGTVTGGGTYPYGTTVDLLANNSEGYTFDHWQDDDTHNPRTITVTGDATYTATFSPNQYTINTNVTPENSGTVTGGGTYDYGTTVELRADPNNGYTFDHWQDGNNQNPRTIRVTGNATYTASFSQNMYIITTNVSPEGSGTVTGGGAFHYNEHTTLTATPTPNSDFEFQSWDDGNTDNPRPITVTGNATYTALFVEHGSFVVTATVNPVGSGTVTGTGSFPEGSSTTLTAHPNNGYSFNHWQDGNTDNPRTVPVNGNLSFIAYFTQNTYNITTHVSPAGSGTVTGGGNSYHYGDQVILTATANSGYTFDHWNDGNTQNPRTFTVTGNATYTAYFTQAGATEYTITTTVTPVGSGTVDGGGTYPSGTQVTLTANANNGFTFDHWQDGNRQNPRTITVTGNATYTATFKQDEYTITTKVTPEGSGRVNGGGDGFHYGDQTILTAIANNGYTFDYWQDGNTDNPRTITVTDNATYTATFKGEKYTITVIANNNDWGTVTGGGQFSYGETTELKATANSGYEFMGWDDGNNDNPRQITVTCDSTFTAIFAEEGSIYYNVTTEVRPIGAGRVTGGGTYPENTDIILEAIANVGYTFSQWQDGNTENPRSYTVNESISFTAHFTTNTYTINAVAHPEDGGTIEGGGPYIYGVDCTLKARSKPGYTFINWTENGIVVSTNNTYTFTVERDRDLIANFTSEQQHTITATANPEEGGTVTGGGTYASGVTCKLKATPNTGYTFINWTEDGTAVSSNATYTFPVTNDRNLIANFEKDEVPCIDNDKIQKIVPKDHTEDNETYTLILVYPNPDEEYVYQWCYAPETDSLNYRDLNVNDGTYNKQYFYRGGALIKGYYKVRISKEKGGCSPVETEPYHVTYKHATQLRIYPNPSRRDHNIVIVNDSNGPSQLSIYSTDGRLLHAQTVTDNQTTLNLNLPSGVYIAYLTDSDGYTKIGKLVIQ